LVMVPPLAVLSSWLPLGRPLWHMVGVFRADPVLDLFRGPPVTPGRPLIVIVSRNFH
jgi:hypothetical protein